jgi:hypothetical protein
LRAGGQASPDLAPLSLLFGSIIWRGYLAVAPLLGDGTAAGALVAPDGGFSVGGGGWVRDGGGPLITSKSKLVRLMVASFK